MIKLKKLVTFSENKIKKDTKLFIYIMAPFEIIGAQIDCFPNVCIYLNGLAIQKIALIQNIVKILV